MRKTETKTAAKRATKPKSERKAGAKARGEGARVAAKPAKLEQTPHPAVTVNGEPAKPRQRRNISSEIGGILVLLLGSSIFLALISFEPSDLEGLGETANLIGPVGVHLGDIMLHLFGLGAFFFAGVVIILGFFLLIGRQIEMKPSEMVGQVLLVVSGAVLAHMLFDGDRVLGHMPGGAVGAVVGEMSRTAFNDVGTYLTSAACVALGFVLATDLSFSSIAEAFVRLLERIGAACIAPFRALYRHARGVLRKSPDVSGRDHAKRSKKQVIGSQGRRAKTPERRRLSPASGEPARVRDQEKPAVVRIARGEASVVAPLAPTMPSGPVVDTRAPTRPAAAQLSKALPTAYSQHDAPSQAAPARPVAPLVEAIARKVASPSQSDISNAGVDVDRSVRDKIASIVSRLPRRQVLPSRVVDGARAPQQPAPVEPAYEYESIVPPEAIADGRVLAGWKPSSLRAQAAPARKLASATAPPTPPPHAPHPRQADRASGQARYKAPTGAAVMVPRASVDARSGGGRVEAKTPCTTPTDPELRALRVLVNAQARVPAPSDADTPAELPSARLIQGAPTPRKRADVLTVGIEPAHQHALVVPEPVSQARVRRSSQTTPTKADGPAAMPSAAHAEDTDPETPDAQLLADMDDDEDDDVSFASSAEVEAPLANVVSPKLGPAIVLSEAQQKRVSEDDLEQASARRKATIGTFQAPPLSLLGYQPQENAVDDVHLREMADRLERKLADYKVKAKVVQICPGPVVTRFELSPAPGTKVATIAGLADDLKMALETVSIRVIAPIPGKGVVGIEVPNPRRETVYLKEILGSAAFEAVKSPLAFALGKDVEGAPVVSNLAKMPHLLVAGSTGSGKSVSVNAMICSLLYNASPKDVRLILVDPKRLELSVYDGIPHLLLPPITDPKKAATALRWAVEEMERRYTLMAEMGVRNIKGYNSRVLNLEKRSHAGDTDATTELGQDAYGEPRHSHMPYIVVIIDELADLMMVAAKEVEASIARLAQMARACGIHLVLATQRPSVDVITGLIKANFPTRIAFRVFSRHDSKTILDKVGAEALLGMGDMLFLPPGAGVVQRVHGAFLSDEEVERVVSFLKKQGTPEYNEDILRPQEEAQSGPAEEEEIDELYDRAVVIVTESQQASISMLQRKLRVGYNRAARMIEKMEDAGVVGPSDGSRPREVLRPAI